jgi:pilus assembly protein CpaF
MRTDLHELVFEHEELADLDPAGRRLALRSILAEVGVDDLAHHTAAIADEIDGFGPLTDLMRHPTATDIFINGPTMVSAEIDGQLEDGNTRFRSAEHLLTWCERLVSTCGGRLDASRPIADVRLHDGSRMHVVLPPVAPDGPVVSIRRFPSVPFDLQALVDRGALTAAQGHELRDHVASGSSILVSGPTGAGKTTLLGALLREVPAGERVLIIEELPELRTGGPNRIHLNARPANAEGAGGIELDQLVRAALRMRPDRVVVGEVRGPEALAAIGAMRTGHAGAMLSIHAASAADARRRLIDLALSCSGAPSEATLEREVQAAVDVCVHLTRQKGRRVDEISTR